MGLIDALAGTSKQGEDYFAEYMKKRIAQKKSASKMGMAKTRGGSSQSGKDAEYALNDEYENQ